MEVCHNGRGGRTTSASTASSLKLRRANARLPLTHSVPRYLVWVNSKSSMSHERIDRKEGGDAVLS